MVFVLQAWWAARALAIAEELAPDLQDAIAHGDVPKARTRLDAFKHATSRAHHATDGPLWWLGAHIPIAGRNVDAVRTIAREGDAIATQALPKIVDVADQVRLETFRPKKGRVNLAAVARTLPVMSSTRRVLLRADREVSPIEVGRLAGPLQKPVGDFQHRIHVAFVAVSSATDAGNLMPEMLGADGKTRRYLMLVLNNAEVRSLSGMPGSVAVITTRRGKIKMGKQGGIHDIPPLEHAAIKISAEKKAGFQTSIATDMRDATIVPDFPRAAELAAAVVGKRWHQRFDGVVAIDPVALSYVLAGVGSINVGDGLVLNQGNAAYTLLNGVYVKYPTNINRQDDVFELAARRTFDALVDGHGDSVTTVRGLVRGVQERRVMLWTRSSRLEHRIHRGGISGALSDDRKRPEVGFFVNDAASTKMEYFLRMGSRLRSLQCGSDGAQLLKLSTEIRSEAPQGYRRMSLSVTGLGRYVAPGNMRLHGLVMAPLGGRIVAMWVDGQRAPVGATTYKGHQIAQFARVLPPGETSLVTVQMVTAPRYNGAPLLRTTPGIFANEDAAGASACN